MPSRLLLLDGHSLAYRAFFALPAENFRTGTGQTTNAVYGFTAMLINLLRDEQPTHIAVAFDVSGLVNRSMSSATTAGGFANRLVANSRSLIVPYARRCRPEHLLTQRGRSRMLCWRSTMACWLTRKRPSRGRSRSAVR